MDGKKKKNKNNKKKGGGQTKLAEGVQNAYAGEAVVLERDNDAAPQANHLSQVSSTTDVQSVGVSESDIELDRHKVYEEKFVKLQEEVRQLQEEKNQWFQKEATLEEKVKLLQDDIDSCIKKEASLELKLENIQSENNFFIEKEAILENRVKHVEGIKDSWILKETLINEMASRLDEVNVRLQEQVKELKESRDSLIQENSQLRESIAVMESRVHRIETEAFLSGSSPAMVTEAPAEEMPHYQSEASPPPLMEKTEPEQTELVEKVKEVYLQSDLHSTAAYRSSTPVLDTVERLVDSAMSVDHAPEYSQEMHISGEILPSVARTHNPFGIPNGIEGFTSPSVVGTGQLVGMDDSRISADIVSVPLDDIQVQEAQSTVEEEEPLPISDAPLIGAPFRLISFFAKYVSGADLVQQDGAR